MHKGLYEIYIYKINNWIYFSWFPLNTEKKNKFNITDRLTPFCSLCILNLKIVAVTWVLNGAIFFEWWISLFHSSLQLCEKFLCQALKRKNFEKLTLTHFLIRASTHLIHRFEQFAWLPLMNKICLAWKKFFADAPLYCLYDDCTAIMFSIAFLQEGVMDCSS